MERIVVAISGSGRTLQNLLAQQDRHGTYEVAGVIASRADCRGYTFARNHDLPVVVDPFQSGSVPSVALVEWLSDVDARWIVLAGFIKKFPTQFHHSCPWAQHIVNIHPALLPAYGGPGMYGANVHRAIIAAGEAESGATVHFVNENYDEGSIIAQVRVPVLAEDDAEALAARVFAAESSLYPYTLSQLIKGNLPLCDGKIYDYTFRERPNDGRQLRDQLPPL